MWRHLAQFAHPGASVRLLPALTQLHCSTQFYKVVHSVTQFYLACLPPPSSRTTTPPYTRSARCPTRRFVACRPPPPLTANSSPYHFQIGQKKRRKEMGQSDRWNNAIREQRHSRSSIQMQVGSLTRCYVQQKQGGCLEAPPLFHQNCRRTPHLPLSPAAPELR